MSSKPYLIVNVVEGEIGAIKERDTYDEAIDIAVVMAKGQCDTPEAQIRKELEASDKFISNNKDIQVVLAQVDDD